MLYLPNNFIIRAGIGHASHQLGAFDRALVQAGVDGYNLIQVSSILPPRCTQQQGISLPKGALLPSAFTCAYSSTIGEIISSAVAVAVPCDKSKYGIIMHHSQHGTKEETEKLVREFAEEAMRDRDIEIDKIISASTEVKANSTDIHCAFATVSMW